MFHECNVEMKDGQPVPKANFVKEAVCPCCGAPVYVEEVQAHLVARPMLHYTCESPSCPGRHEEPYWSPRVFRGLLDKDGKPMNRSKKKKKPEKEDGPTIIVPSNQADIIENWM